MFVWKSSHLSNLQQKTVLAQHRGAHIVAVFVIVQLRQGFEDRRTCPVGGAEATKIMDPQVL